MKIKSGQEWDFDKIDQIYIEIEKIAKEKYDLNCYPNQLEIISSEQMLDAYSSIGLPLYYSHWSFGERFVKELEAYKRGRMGLAFEIVINSDPCIAYLMEENTMMMQTLVIAHASFGHNHFFKNNYLFKQWTDADSIIDYLAFAKKFIRDCEEKYGVDEVEAVIDAAHSLEQYGFDKYNRPEQLSAEKEKKLRKEREDYIQLQLNDIWKTVPKTKEDKIEENEERFPKDPHENILYFIEKNAPRLDDWKREIIRIIRKISQYFLPQRQCLTGNHLVSTKNGLTRLSKLITTEGYIENDKIEILTEGNTFTSTSHVYLKRKQTVIQVTTQSGRVYTGTPEHPLSLLNEKTNSINIVEIQNMLVGQYLTLSVGYDRCFSNNFVSLTQPKYSKVETCELCGFKSVFLATHLTQTHGIAVNEYKRDFEVDTISAGIHRYNKSKNKIVIYPFILNVNMAEFLGYLICNKPYAKTNQTFNWGFVNIYLAKQIKYLLNNLFGIEVGIEFDKYCIYRIKFNSFDLHNFLICNFSENVLFGYDIHVPEKILSSPKDVVAAFIRGIIDNKSTRRNNISTFELNFKDSELDSINEITTMLIGMGIVAETIKKSNMSIVGLAANMGINIVGLEDYIITENNILRILPPYKRVFEEKIGTIFDELDVFSGKSRGNSSAIIPNAKEMLDSITKDLKFAKKEHIKNIHNFKQLAYKQKLDNGLLLKQQLELINIYELYDNRGKYITLGDYRENLDKFNNLMKLNTNKANDLLKYLEDSNDLYYDKIVKIELLDELQDVYDVTIPKNHLFYVDGIISHNTALINEGTATFFHHKIVHDLYDKGIVEDGAMLEFYASHTGVINQLNFDDPNFSGINPYALGFAMFQDIERISMNPTKEDREWFDNQSWVGNGDWLKNIKWAIANFKDESFIQQFISPKVIRNFRMFAVHDDEQDPKLLISGIHNEQGYKTVRTALSKQYNLGYRIPDIQVYNVDRWGDRTLTLRHYMVNKRPLESESTTDTLQYISFLWGYNVRLESVDTNEEVRALYDIMDQETVLDIFLEED